MGEPTSLESSSPSTTRLPSSIDRSPCTGFVSDITDAVAAIRALRPAITGVVVKLDDSGAGDGNLVIDLREPDAVERAVGELPDWYIDELGAGGVVEELVSGAAVTSPSVQLDMLPDGTVHVLATHEQVLGGASAQVYMGCRFPADAYYAPQLAIHGKAVGELLARRGARGRAGVDSWRPGAPKPGTSTRSR